MNDASSCSERTQKTTEANSVSSNPFEFRVEIIKAETHGPSAPFFLAGEKMPCFLGLSPESSSLNRGRLRSILLWLIPRASQLIIAEGSFLTRWNLGAFERVSEVEAEQIAKERQDLAAQRISKTLSDLPGADGVEIMNWAAVVHGPGFNAIRSRIERFAREDATFERAVMDVVGEFISRKKVREGVLTSSEDKMAMLRSYVIEEVTMFIHLYQIGLRTEIYPGEDLTLMRELSAGRFANFPFDLSCRNHIAIQLTPI